MIKTYSEIVAHIEQSDVLEMAYQFHYGPKIGIFGSGSEVADACVTQHGFKPIGKLWGCSKRDEAMAYLSRLLHRSLAYSVEMFSSTQSDYIAKRIVSLVDLYSGKFMVNGSFYESGFGCSPIGTATFEMAIVFYDESNIGMFYIEDED